uniref:ZAD domain-containing protein n=1 Tax=Anopheles atroparvus TaxID=41427 RepID=A0AAG5DTI7_ANOAO
MERVIDQKTRTVVEEAENIDSLCRVCSAPGSHSIFARIPAYCHEHYREYARWKQPIYLLISEVTGIEITDNDGLPKKICVLCISYLKHAYTFRRQTIDNMAGLLAAKYLSGNRPVMKKKLPDEEFNDANGMRSGDRADAIIPTGAGGSYRSVNLCATANGRSAVKQTKKATVMHRFVVRQKPPNNNVEEDVDNLQGLELIEPSSGLFGYREKEFVEDDVMDLDGLQEHGITFTLPEDYKEKKCFACRKRFMFTETYSQHLTECLLYKLTESIRSLHHIMFLREQSAISAFEFIRRAVFTIRKCYRLVLSYDGELDGVDVGEPVATDETDGADLKLSRSRSSSPGEPADRFLPDKRTYGRIELDSLSDSGSSGSPKAKALPEVYRFAPSMNNNVPPLMLPFQPQPPSHPHPLESFVAAMASHSNVDIIKNRLTKTEAEEVNESNDRYKTIRCKQCDARFYTISHLDEHTKKVHQRPVGKNNPFGL